MLGKLLKHEFGATARYFIPLYGLILILSPLFAIMVKLTRDFDIEYSNYSMMASFLMFAIFGYAFLIIATFIATLILIVIRFYKTTATSEAYLTFTLPVKTHQIILSKMIAAVVWEILAAMVALAAIFVMVCISGLATPAGILNRLQEFFSNLLFDTDAEDMLTISLVLISALTSVFASVMKVYSSIAIGQLFRNHRVLISIGFYFAIYFALQFISFMFSFGGLMLLNSDHEMIYINYTYIISIIQNVAIAAVGFFITTWIMKKHLNVM